MQSRGRRLAIAASTRLNFWLLDHGHLADRHLAVVEYPKSGGTWLARLLATALEWPFLDDWPSPVGNYCVLRGTTLKPNGKTNHVYVMRDPRDVYVSFFHHRARHWEGNPRYRDSWLGLHADPLDPQRIREQLPAYIRHERNFAGRRGAGAAETWSSHVAKYLDVADKVPGTTYEALRSDPVSELRAVLKAVTGTQYSAEVAAAAVAAHDFEARKDAKEWNSSRSFLRAGKAGGWRQKFSREAGRVVEELDGDVMRRAGYEDTSTWWKSLDD